MDLEMVEMLDTITPEQLRVVAGWYRDEKNNRVTREEIATILDYIADLKSPCKKGDVSCLEHKRKNCRCLENREESYIHGEGI